MHTWTIVREQDKIHTILVFLQLLNPWRSMWSCPPASPTQTETINVVNSCGGEHLRRPQVLLTAPKSSETLSLKGSSSNDIQYINKQTPRAARELFKFLQVFWLALALLVRARARHVDQRSASNKHFFVADNIAGSEDEAPCRKNHWGISRCRGRPHILDQTRWDHSRWDCYQSLSIGHMRHMGWNWLFCASLYMHAPYLETFVDWAFLRCSLWGKYSWNQALRCLDAGPCEGLLLILEDQLLITLCVRSTRSTPTQRKSQMKVYRNSPLKME